MKKQTENAVYACLYHDIGKIIYRTGKQVKHSELGYEFVRKEFPDMDPDVYDAVRYHHGRELKDARVSPHSLAYITYLADNISAGLDRRENDNGQMTFKRDVALSPVFIHMNGEHPGYYLRPEITGKGGCVMPQREQPVLDTRTYQYLEDRLRENIHQMSTGEPWINSHLAMLESLTSQIPSSTNVAESVDISLYDHLKTTAAAGACLSEYAIAEHITDYKQTFMTHEKAFRDEKCFLMYSADLSGIQNFIYTVQTTHALKTLRSRSFFLELLMEHYADEILAATGLARTNLLYSGGGHCYLLLPNTEETVAQLQRMNKLFNHWLFERFGILLYIAHGYAPCSANDLMNKPQEGNPYRRIFRTVSDKIAYHKLHRYDAETLLAMNNQKQASGSRECKVCGRTDHLTKDGVCQWCSTFELMSEKIRKLPVYYITETKGQSDFSLPGSDGDVYVTITDVETAKKMVQNDTGLCRVYTKNEMYTGVRYATRLHIGDYAADTWVNELAKRSTGIERLGVCRMDVDNLGEAFVRGFEEKEGNRQRYVTISRTSAFSRNMSLFFKNYINYIFSGRTSDERSLNVLIIYSGGDDIFFVGAWNDVIEGAKRIEKAFETFTCGSLTISAGIGIFGETYPVRLFAEKTGELEDRAKQHKGKRAVTLFEAGRQEEETPEDTEKEKQKKQEENYYRASNRPATLFEKGGQTYDWTTYLRKVEGEKLATLREFFDPFFKQDQKESAASSIKDNEKRGMAFLYRMTSLLRESAEDSLNLARLAYVLSRLEPSKQSSQYEPYRKMKDAVYRWAMSPDDRKQLLTAIYLYVYERRAR